MASPISQGKLAIVMDDAKERRTIAQSFLDEFEVFEAANHDEARKILQDQSIDVLLLELQSEPTSLRACLTLQGEIRESELDTLVIPLSDDRRKASALKAMDAGAYDFFLKPVDADVLRPIVVRALEKLRTDRENRLLRDELHRKNAFGDLLGVSQPMQTLFDSIRRVAQSGSTVSIRGESGTGKELVARSIHQNSPRRDRAFISVNCAALPETLMEAELFGFEKGAFTGALVTKEGRMELAHRGTLFLDEIGTLTPALQSKLLRVLEEHSVVRLGGKRPVKLDFRLITATNEDLETLVRKGQFREDLYYRIHVFPLYVPPLRERTEDIPLLIDYFVQVHCATNRLPPKQVANDAMSAFERYPWPGNVRELENAVQRSVLMTDENVITLRSLPKEVLDATASDSRGRFKMPAKGIRLAEEVAAFEKRWIEAALADAGGVKAQAAKRLGIGKDQMKYLCRKHNL